jgi:3',5'-cyclic AMP phosphodiesterase CpdA
MNHFNPPNESATNGVTSAGGDYWFKYGYTLYIVLNTNNTNISTHDSFIGQAIAANPDTTWTIVMFHQSLYSSAGHSTEAPIIELRESLSPVIDKHQIDVVLSGHDHCYTRTYQMLNGTAQTEQPADIQGRMVNPTGTLYITAGSASGSKYYNLNKAPEAYSAVRLQLYTPAFSNILVSDDTITITTYRVDTMEAIDTYTIVKNTATGFFDVPDAAWYSPAVGFLQQRILSIRATMAQVLYKLLSEHEMNQI